MLIPMRYKNFVWPNNPGTFEVRYGRASRQYKIPFTDEWKLLDLGKGARVFSGEGEFEGPDAYDSFARLAQVFSEGGQSLLYHPIWGSCMAVFSKLSLREEPLEDYVAYSFEFTEAYTGGYILTPDAQPISVYIKQYTDQGMTAYITAGASDTLAGIAQTYDKELSELAAKNPHISDSDTVIAGKIVRV